MKSEFLQLLENRTTLEALNVFLSHGGVEWSQEDIQQFVSGGGIQVSQSLELLRRAGIIDKRADQDGIEHYGLTDSDLSTAFRAVFQLVEAEFGDVAEKPEDGDIE
jgi:hypothetical protein